MDGNGVTDVDVQNNNRGGDASSRSPLFRYSNIFDDLCPYYMSIGMSYQDYWDGDCEMVIPYRKAAELDKERQNTYLWLQGMYFYNALLCASPVLNALSKDKKPRPYLEEPIPITRKYAEKQEDDREKKQFEENLNAMDRFMAEINKKFEKGGEEDGNTDGRLGVSDNIERGERGEGDRKPDSGSDKTEVGSKRRSRSKRVHKTDSEAGRSSRSSAEHK